MAECKCYYYSLASGEKPVEGFISSLNDARVLYFFLRQDAVVFTNGFIKKTGKIPKNEIDLAIRRRKACLQLKLEGENN